MDVNREIFPNFYWLRFTKVCAISRVRNIEIQLYIHILRPNIFLVWLGYLLKYET